MLGAEQFGTNLRATVTTSVPNFVRGSVVLLNLGVNFFKPSFGFMTAIYIVGAISFALSIIATLLQEESFHKDLDYFET
jgi:putative MFS transporter